MQDIKIAHQDDPHACIALGMLTGLGVFLCFIGLACMHAYGKYIASATTQGRRMYELYCQGSAGATVHTCTTGSLGKDVLEQGCNYSAGGPNGQ